MKLRTKKQKQRTDKREILSAPEIQIKTAWQIYQEEQHNVK
jgi:hypothetical protein